MKAAVLGSPVAHSLSPVLHAAGYAELGLSDWSYGRFELQAADLDGFVAGLDSDWRGLSLTMPLKEACLEVASEVTPLAVRAGAGNTLVHLDSGGWRADNTDVPGLVDALRPAWGAGWTRAAILGAGATARSALLALVELEATRVRVYARNPARGEEFRAWAVTAAPGTDVSIAPLDSWAGGTEPAVLSTLPGGAGDGLVPEQPVVACDCFEVEPVCIPLGDDRVHVPGAMKRLAEPAQGGLEIF